MKRIALLVNGCNYANSQYSLDGCINDAMDFSSTLVDLYSRSGVDVKLSLCLDRGGGVSPTKNNIIAMLRRVIAQTNQGVYDSFIFYFAGHGLQLADNGADEADRKDECLLTADGQMLLDDDLYLLITRLKSSRQATFVFDCCHSGTVLDLPKVPIGGAYSKGGRMNPRANVISVAACAEHGKSIERNGRGMFTSYLCTLLRKRGMNTKIGPLVSSIRKYLIAQNTGMEITASCSKNVALRKSSIGNVKTTGGKGAGKSRGLTQGKKRFTGGCSGKAAAGGPYSSTQSNACSRDSRQCAYMLHKPWKPKSLRGKAAIAAYPDITRTCIKGRCQDLAKMSKKT